jgi:hypothetical protein
MKNLAKILLIPAIALLAPHLAMADSIDPATFEEALDAGESVTIRKTVVVEEGTTSAVLDVMFLIDTSGSMGGEIEAAKAAAADILAGLGAFGDLSAGVGYYDEPGPGPGWPPAIVSDLSSTADDTIFDGITLGMGGGGGDFPEEGIRSVTELSDGASWSPGSNRFIIALGDATFKESDGFTLAGALAAMDDKDITFIGLDFGFMTRDEFGGIDPTVLADATGGAIYTASTDPATIVAAILDSITASFLTYSTVGVSDLGNGLPGVAVSTACVSADGSECSGDTAIGSWDRSVARTFEFDVTFTALTEGTHSFDTYALVDRGIVATEADIIRVGEGVATVPEPGTLALFGAGLLGMGLMRRRRSRG